MDVCYINDVINRATDISNHIIIFVVIKIISSLAGKTVDFAVNTYFTLLKIETNFRTICSLKAVTLTNYFIVL